MGGLRSLWWRRAAEHHNAQQTRMWAEYQSRGYDQVGTQTTVRPRPRPRTEPQDPVLFGVLMALAIGVMAGLLLALFALTPGLPRVSKIATAGLAFINTNNIGLGWGMLRAQTGE